MESSARRRLDSIARHLLTPETVPRGLRSARLRGHHLISLNPVGAVESNPEGSSPVIIGGMVLDIHAKPSTHPIPGTTMPGEVRYISGGVARNIAECMSKLGSKPYIISVVGLDMAGDLLLKYWMSAGLSMEGILRSEGISTPVVSIIFDASGEMAAAVASVEAVESYLTQDWIRQFEHNISSAPVLMVDANLHPQLLELSCQTAGSGVPVWFEPVSVTKSRRITSIIKYVTCTTPNENELIAMANALSPGKKFNFIDSHRNGQPVQSLFQMLKPAILCLLEKGIKLLIVTLGSDGVFLCSKEGPDFLKDAFKKSNTTNFGRQLYELVYECCPSRQFVCSTKFKRGYPHLSAFHFPTLPASVVSLTGAGDCLVGGMLASACSGLDLMQSTAVGIAVAKAAVETESNVPLEYNLASIADDAKQIFWAAKPFEVD